MTTSWKYFDRRYMQYNGACANCDNPTWVTDSLTATFYSGKHFYDVHKQVTGVWFGSGLTFCQTCYEQIQLSVNEDGIDMA